MKTDELSLEADPEPEFDEDGYTSVTSPTEEEAAFEGLLDSGLSEEEAQETVDYMRPLSGDEEEILDEHPELEGLTRVDDAEQEQWLGQKFSEGTKAMDRVLEDAVYGEDNMRDEEQMERNDTDSGWGIRSLARRARRGLRKAASAPGSIARRGGRLAKRGLKTPFKFAKRFVPNRDKQKAKLVRNLYRKLWFEHANWLAQQDKASNVPLKTRAEYEAVAKIWARSEIAKRKLPLKYTVSGAVILGSEIMGSDLVGSWWNPFSWFQSQVNVVVNNTKDQRADQAPEEQASDAQQPGDMSTDVQDTETSYPEEPSDESGWNGVRQLKSPHDPVADSLGAFAAHVLGKDLPARDNPNVDEIVRGIAAKLRAGQAIGPGEVGLLSSAAKEGNEGARKVVTVLRSRGAVVSGDESGLDPWMYKLNPTYWLSSKRKREFVDKERKAWKDNARLREELAKKQKDLSAAERAVQAAQAVEQAKAQSAETEAQLKAIADSLKGSVSGSLVGHEDVTPVSEVVKRALAKTGKTEAASKLYAKVREGEPLDEQELREARQIARLVGRVRVVHGGIVNSADASMHGALVGACALGGITVALDQNLKQQKAADLLAQKLASGRPLQQEERDGLARVLRGQQKLKRFTSSLVSGRALAGCPKSWVRGAFVGAVKASDPESQKMIESIAKLAKVGNPRAQKALALLRKTGEISGGDDLVGISFSLKKAFKYATAPVWLPAKGLYKGGKWLGKKTGIISSGKSSPEQVRLKRLKAAQKRAAAAAARARAADSQNEAEYRAQQAIAAAADAEADASDAEATAKEQAMRTAEIEAAPDLTRDSEESDDSEGEFVGGWTSLLGKDSKGSKAVAKASEKSPAGQKVRGAAVVFKRAKAGDPKARKAIEVMVAKAKKGDQQALRDVNAMQVARAACEAKAAARKQQLAAAREAKKQRLAAQKVKTHQATIAAREKRFEALRKRFEARTAERLARMERRRNLQKLAKVERKAASGNPKARKFVAAKVSAARKGDKKALAQVQAMTLAKRTRQYQESKRSTWRTERKNLRDARYLAKGILANKPGAVRQYEVIKDAAAKGNPNAKRGMERIALQIAVLKTIQTGVVALPRKKQGGKAPKPGTPAFAQSRKQVESAKAAAKAGTATREELVASARKAEQVGDLKSAGTLAAASASAPSATEGVKRAATEVKAAEAGNPEAKARLDQTLASAKAGNADAVNKLGQVAAARTVEAVEKGQPVPPAMRDAVNLRERAVAGDPAAQEVLQRVSEAATVPNPTPEATAAAVYATGAASLASSLASKPKARRELMEKVNEPVSREDQPAAQAQLAEIVRKTNEGVVTPAESRQGVELAMRLHQPRVAAEISAKSPPLPDADAMSSLPDSPLPPIDGVWQLFKETLKALTLTTRDPLGNYREGVAARSREPATVSGSFVGWSPFKFFMRAKPSLPTLAMLSAPVTATAAVVNMMRNKKGTPKPAAATPTPAKPSASEIPATSSGADDSFKTLVATALRSGKISRRDLDRAVDSNPVARTNPTARKALAEQVRKFLEERKVVVSGEAAPDSPVAVFKVALSKAIGDKKMSREDFNKAVASHLKPGATRDERTLAAARLLRFLEKRGVKIVAGKVPGTASSGADDPRSLFQKALGEKKMSRGDFNQAVEQHCGTGAEAGKRKEFGAKMLAFLGRHGVKVG